MNTENTENILNKNPNWTVLLAGGIRMGDESGALLFKIKTGSSEFYGIWERSYFDNDKKYQIMISRFGYGDRLSVGSTDRFRARFSQRDALVIQSEIEKFFSDTTNVSDIFTTLKPLEYCGAKFCDGWIIKETLHQ